MFHEVEAIKYVDHCPDPKLIELIENPKIDGGHGEYEEFLPEKLRDLSKEFDHTFEPTLEEGIVVWYRVF